MHGVLMITEIRDNELRKWKRGEKAVVIMLDRYTLIIDIAVNYSKLYLFVRIVRKYSYSLQVEKKYDGILAVLYFAYIYIYLCVYNI